MHISLNSRPSCMLKERGQNRRGSTPTPSSPIPTTMAAFVFVNILYVSGVIMEDLGIRNEFIEIASWLSFIHVMVIQDFYFHLSKTSTYLIKY